MIREEKRIIPDMILWIRRQGSRCIDKKIVKVQIIQYGSDDDNDDTVSKGLGAYEDPPEGSTTHQTRGGGGGGGGSMRRRMTHNLNSYN